MNEHVHSFISLNFINFLKINKQHNKYYKNNQITNNKKPSKIIKNNNKTENLKIKSLFKLLIKHVLPLVIRLFFSDAFMKLCLWLFSHTR